MEPNSHSLQEQKYPGPEYFFQAIEMANEEANSELDLEADFFSWKVVKRRQKPQRRYTVSHAAPPAPPSTPTSLSKEHDPLSELSLSMSPTEYHHHHQHHHQHLSDLTDNSIGNGNGPGVAAAAGAAAETNESRLGSLLYILDYAPKYKKKLKEQQRTDAELADLFKVVTITGSGGIGRKRADNGAGGSTSSSSTNGESSSRSTAEFGVSLNSRRIRRPDMSAGSFKIHRNPDDTIRDLNDEDSLSAPEFDATTKFNMNARRRLFRSWRACGKRTPNRLGKKFKIMKRMDEVVDTFDSSMTFQQAP